MPPKADVGVAAGNVTDNDAIALCRMMAHADEFRVNHAKLAPYLNINHGKNVARKINGIVNKLGFDYKEGKMIPRDGDQSVPATPKATTTNAATDDTGGDDGPQTPAPKKKGKAPATPKTPASKKRKVKATQQDDDSDEAGVKNEDVNQDAHMKTEGEDGTDE